MIQDYASPFDGDGHGTHTASVAAGNHGIPVIVAGHHFGNASGMAPRSHIAVYKALYKSFGGFAADVVAAIDQASQDGVDIISLSITPSKRKLQIQGKWRGVDPVIFFKDESIIKSIEAFYGIDKQFPLDGHLVTRNSDTSNVKRIYYISKSVKNVLELNLSVGQQLKITSVGLKIFERQKSREGRSVECAFRIASEGLPLILPHITKQILSASAIDFKHLLQYKNVKFAEFVDAKFGEMVANLKPGCCVIVLGEGNKFSTEAFQVDESSIVIGCWKGRASLTVMVTSIECQELLERLLMRLDRETEKGSSMHEDKPSNDVRYVEQESNGNSQDVEAI